MKNESFVAIYKMDNGEYPGSRDQYRPSVRYPEYPFEELAGQYNPVYEAVRNALYLMGYDKENYGETGWNPLRTLIKPGDFVLIKPNWVLEKNHNIGGGTQCLYTQPDVVAAVIDYVVIALDGSGKIVVGDAPMQSCDFNRLIEESGYKILLDYYRKKGINIELVDFRGLSSVDSHGVRIEKIDNSAEGVVVDLGKASEFYGLERQDTERLRVTCYDPRVLPTHHNGEVQEYFISKYVLGADVVINMPKPKTHRKAGVTIALKNLVGINVRKEYLPHHTKGSVRQGGDEYEKTCWLKSVQSKIYDKKNIYESERKYFRAKIMWMGIGITARFLRFEHNKTSEGSWYGNRTISRTITDLNKILYYTDKQGKLEDTVQRRVLIIADMVIAGEGDGPIAPVPKEVGIIAIGENPLAFDKAVCTLMGMDINRIPTFGCVTEVKEEYPALVCDGSVYLKSNVEGYNNKNIVEIEKGLLYTFEAAPGWKSHIERTEVDGER